MTVMTDRGMMMRNRLPTFPEQPWKEQKQETDSGPVRFELPAGEAHVYVASEGGFLVSRGSKPLDSRDLEKIHNSIVTAYRHSRIQELEEDCKEDGWDGEGAAAVDGETIAAAQTMATLFPTSGTQPEIDATPFGEISFGWDFPGCALLTITVCPSGAIAFSGLLSQTNLHDLSPEKTETVERFTSSWFSMLNSACKNA